MLYHPDKFVQKFGAKLHPDEKQSVLVGWCKLKPVLSEIVRQSISVFTAHFSKCNAMLIQRLVAALATVHGQLLSSVGCICDLRPYLLARVTELSKSLIELLSVFK